MKGKLVLMFAVVFCSAISVKAGSREVNDIRDRAVLESKMVKSIISGLRAEQGLSCVVAIEEDGNQSIAYYSEDDLSKFSVGFLCDDGRSAIITGVLGDGGQSAVETFRLSYAN